MTLSRLIPSLRAVTAHHGPYTYRSLGWKPGAKRRWVVDCLVAAAQYQRIGEGQPFLRQAGTCALYSPETSYYERIDERGTVIRSWVTFEADGELAGALGQITGSSGFCFFQDPDEVIRSGLERLGRLAVLDRSRHELTFAAVLLQVLGHLTASSEIARHVREVRDPLLHPVTGWLAEVEAEIEARVGEPLRVIDLAEAMGEAESTFAHRYTRLAGESPYQAILRLKVAAAKRRLSAGMSVKDVAGELAFSSPFSFSRSFKSRVGLSPTDWLHGFRRERPSS